MTPATTSVPGSADPKGLQRFYAQRLAWHRCGKFSCSELTVPEDYQHPAGKTLRVAVIRYEKSRHPSASLIVNPGGPGGSGVQFVRGAYPAFEPLLSQLALVSFDPRGVGASAPIRCVSSRFLDEYLNEPPAPQTATQVALDVRQARAFAADCYRRNGSYLEHVGTIDAARDMDVLRAALGDQQLTYYGASYGTYLGAKYAQLFPQRIRAMVLDGAVDPAEPAEAADRDQAVGFETDLNDFLRRCARRPACPFGPTISAAKRWLRSLMGRISTHPETVGSRQLGIGNFVNGLASGFYDASDWPELQIALQHAADGNGAGMLRFADPLNERRPNGSYSNLIESNNAINCVDRPAPRSIATIAADARADAKVAPFFGAAIAWSSLPCSFWKVPPVETAHPVHAPDTSSTIVVVGTTHDPATPYRNAVALTRELGNARLVTRDGDGHTAFLSGNVCVYQAVGRYLLFHQLPLPDLVCH